MRNRNSSARIQTGSNDCLPMFAEANWARGPMPAQFLDSLHRTSAPSLSQRCLSFSQSFRRIHGAAITRQRKTKEPPSANQFRKDVPWQIARDVRRNARKNFRGAETNARVNPVGGHSPALLFRGPLEQTHDARFGI